MKKIIHLVLCILVWQMATGCAGGTKAVSPSRGRVTRTQLMSREEALQKIVRMEREIARLRYERQQLEAKLRLLEQQRKRKILRFESRPQVRPSA